MDRTKIFAALVPALMLLGCGEREAAREEETPSAAASPQEPGAADHSLVATPAVVTNGAPDLTPPVLTPEAERGEQGARNLLLSFARAIELKEFGQAWALLSDADKAKWSKAQFAATFADLEKITVAVPTGEMEGAAGSSFYTAPVTVTGSEKNGRPVRIEGEAVLRRVNDVPGASAEQLRWNFERLTLEWTH